MATRDLKRVDVLVTGATGFIGSHLVRALIEAGANVHILARRSSSLESLGESARTIRIHHGDVTDRIAVADCLSAANPEVVFHLAANLSARHTDIGPGSVHDLIAVNLEGTLNVVNAAAGLGTRVRKLIRTGSIGEYGRAPTPFDELVRERPLSTYAASIVAATHFCQALAPNVPFDLVTLRPALVYGAGQDQRFFIAQLVRSCLDGIDFEMTEGSQKRDFIYVADVVRGMLAAAVTDSLGGEVINLATGKGYALTDVADLVVRLTGSTIQVKRGVRSSAGSDLADHVSSTVRAKERLGWRAEIDLHEGLRRTIDLERGRRG